MSSAKKTGRILLLLAGVGVLAAPAAGWDWSQDGTWPPVSVNITEQNGWVWALGLVEGNDTHVAWRTRLAPAGAGVSVQHGWNTTFVQVSARNYVIDNASGVAHVLGPDEIWRRGETGQEAGGGTPVSPGDIAAEHAQVTAQQAKIAQLTEANQRLTEQLEQLKRLQQLHEQDTVTQAELGEAQMNVEAARRNLHRTHQELTEHMRSAVPAGDLTAPYGKLTEAEQARLDKAKADVVQAEAALDTGAASARLAKARGEPLAADDPAYKAMDSIYEQYVDARIALLKVELQQACPPAGDLPAELQSKLTDAIDAVLDATRKCQRQERKVQELRQAGKDTTNDFQDALKDLTERMEDLSGAYKALAALQQQARDAVKDAK